MDPRSEPETWLDPLFGSDDWRDRSELNSMSISELVSELRDTFLRSDFDRVEETLVAREARLKAEIEEKKREIGLLQEKVQFERLEKISVELELKRIKGEKRGEENGNGFGLDVSNKAVKTELGRESCELEVLKNTGVGGDGVASAVAEMESEKVEVLEEKKIRISEPIKKDGLGASAGGRLGIGNVINLEDSDEDERSSKATLNRKETTSCVIADNELQSSSGAVLKTPTTRLTEPNGILKRQFSASREFYKNINILDGLDSDASSSSCSSSSSSGGSLDMDIFSLRSLPSNKKMRTNATNLGLDS